MSIWYRVGTVSVANGATAVTGSGTGWTNQVKEGDRIRFATGDRWYEVGATPTSNTALTLATALIDVAVIRPLSRFSPFTVEVFWIAAAVADLLVKTVLIVASAFSIA